MINVGVLFLLSKFEFTISGFVQILEFLKVKFSE